MAALLTSDPSAPIVGTDSPRGAAGERLLSRAPAPSPRPLAGSERQPPTASSSFAATGGGDTDEGDRSCGTDGATPQPSGLSAPLAGTTGTAATRFAPGCEESAFPELTGLRLALGYTRRDLAVIMRAFLPDRNVLSIADHIRRVEQLGQHPDDAFVDAVAAAFAMSRDAARSLFNLPLD